jgi:Transposase Tn5 dimerisation domain/Transposase DNA-binding
MAEAPDRSLPDRHGSWGDIKAAYRFLNNPKVTPDGIQSAHRQQVRQLCRSPRIVLAVEDGSELDYTAHPSVEGLGFVGGGIGRGLLQHSTLAVTSEGHLLGILHQIWWKRVRTPKGEKRRQRQARIRESDLWADSIRAVGAIGPNTRVVHVMDRGADCYETMHAAYAANQGFLIRAKHDRYVNDSTEHLWGFMERQAVAGMRVVEVPARPAKGQQPAQPARRARLAVRYAEIQVPAPRNDPRFQDPLRAWAVYVMEIDVPAGVEPVEWMLLTSERVENLDRANLYVDWYTHRWLIEEWHKAEKTGCRLEAAQRKTAEALERLAALTAVVAVRLIQLRELAQAATDPGVPAQKSLRDEPAALRNLVPPDWIIVVSHLAKCRAEALTPRLFWLTLARRGGFIGRKSDGLPGWQTIWKGWAEVLTLVQGVEIHRAILGERTYG